MTSLERGPWGPGATLALFVVIAGGVIAAQTFAAVAYAVIVSPDTSPEAIEKVVRDLGGDGLFVALAEMVTGLVALALTVSFVWFRYGPSVRDYLALHAPPNPTIAAWLVV